MNNTQLQELDAFHLLAFLSILNNPKLQNSYSVSLKIRFPDTYKYIDNRYPQLNGHKFGEKCYWLMHNMNDFPKCPICQKSIISYQNIFIGYSKTCSSKCGGKNKILKYIREQQFVPSNELDIKFRNELENLNLNYHNNSFMNTLLKFGYILNYVNFRYDKLINHDILEKLYWFKNNIDDFPKCIICGKQSLSFRNIVIGYSTHCNGCQYLDPNHGKSISNGYHEHVKKDPNFKNEIKQKRIQTNLKNGHSPTWNNVEKAKETISKNPNHWKERTLKTKETNIRLYGDPTWNNVEKAKETNIERYGVSYQWQRKEVKQKTMKANQRNLGVDWPGQSPKCQNKAKQTCLNTYGYEYPAQVPKIQLKIQKSKLINGSYGKSKAEDEAFYMLFFIFPKLVRQYRSEKYPFNCDFYDPQSNTYFEYNGLWTHGGHFFDSTNNDDIKKLNLWKLKNSDFYRCAIDVWTKSDVLKHQTAINNNLKYVVFWNLSEVRTYITSYFK